MLKQFLTVVVLGTAAIAQTFDGPAELPRITMGLATPSPNTPKLVNAVDDLQAALNSVVPGDLIIVDPGNVKAGGVILPCTSGWVTIINSRLPVADNTRIHTDIPMPKIFGPVRGGCFVRLVGFEITRACGTGIVYDLIIPGKGSHEIIFDRNWIHGCPTDETTRGASMHDVYNWAFVNNRMEDFFCIATTGACSDSQTIAFGSGESIQTSNGFIQNNYLEAAGENILGGGGPSVSVPTDITIQYNDLVKRDSWNPMDPSYDGVKRIVKNWFELKNGRRVLFQGNRMVGNWGGFSQIGFGILLTPKNQGTNQCPSCSVEDITVRYNWGSKSGSALSLGLAASDGGTWPSGAGRWRIHDNIFDQLQYADCFQCGQWLVQISSGISPSGLVLHDVSVDHNTFSIDQWLGRYHGFLVLGGPVGNLMKNIRYNNNTQPRGNIPVGSTGGGASNCVTGWINQSDKLSNCGIEFTGNTLFSYGLLDYPNNNVWPEGNFIVQSGANVEALGTAIAVRKP